MNTNKQKTEITDISLRTAALISGFSSILTAIVAGFAFGFVRTSLIVPGDAVVTVNNIMASDIIFRAGIFAWLIIIILDLLVAWSLYVFFKPVNKSISLLTGWLGLVAATMAGIAQLNAVIVLPLISGSDYLKVFEPTQLHALALLFLNAFYKIWSVGLFVFGFHLLLRGYLAFKSGFIPRIFGVLLLPNYEKYKATVDVIISTPLAIGELALAFWLILKGGRFNTKKNRVPESI